MPNCSKKSFFTLIILFFGLIVPFSMITGAENDEQNTGDFLAVTSPSFSSAESTSFETPTLSVNVFVATSAPSKLRTGFCPSVNNFISSVVVANSFYFSSIEIAKTNQLLFLIHRQLLI